MVRGGCLVGVILLATIVNGAGCGLYHVEATSQLAHPTLDPYPTVVVLPPAFNMEHRPHQVYQYTYDLIEVLTQEHRVPVVAPWEYDPSGRLVRDRGEALFAIADTVTGHESEMVLLDFRVDETGTQRAVAASLSMGGGIDRVYEAEVTITLTLRGYPADDELARVVIEFDDRAFGEGASAANPRPLLRDAVQRGGEELARLMAGHWVRDPSAAPDLEVHYNPAGLFLYQGGAGEPLESEFADMDDFDRLAHSLAYYEYFAPGISTRTATFFIDATQGLMVERVGEELESSGLQERDYITAVDGRPVGGPQTLFRPFLAGNERVWLTLMRDGRVEQVELTID